MLVSKYRRLQDLKEDGSLAVCLQASACQATGKSSPGQAGEIGLYGVSTVHYKIQREMKTLLKHPSQGVGFCLDQDLPFDFPLSTEL